MIQVLYGTETGNAELVAEDICDALNEQGLSAQLSDMAQFDLALLTECPIYVFVCSTYGDGELPQSAQSFMQALSEAPMDLSHVQFASFGLGDRYYDTYNNGIKTVELALRQLGARQLGIRGEHDASAGGMPSDHATQWLADSLVPLLAVTV